jgi:hypothetical protein
MRQRHVLEAELRLMLEEASSWVPGAAPGRYEIQARFEGQDWTIVVEPDEAARTLVVVTMFGEYTSG